MTAQSQPHVSVITPVYNEEQHIAECIESVLAQTYTNWDYIIVDNCSTDKTGEIARQYAARESRIRVIRNETFLRAIPNHNNALRRIFPESKYCKVVLGDDWIYPECIERMVAVAEAHPSVAIVGAYSIEGPRVNWTGLPYECQVFSGDEICRRHFLESLHLFGSSTQLLYRADLVRSHDPFYNEANIHADTEVCFTLLKGRDFGFVHQVLTFTRLRPASISAVCAGINSDLAANLHLLVTQGPEFLKTEELQALLRTQISAYYRTLGKNLLRRRDQKFWEYHKRALTDAGVGFSRARVLQGALAVLADAALNPKSTAERLLKRGANPKHAAWQQAKG